MESDAVIGCAQQEQEERCISGPDAQSEECPQAVAGSNYPLR